TDAPPGEGRRGQTCELSGGSRPHGWRQHRSDGQGRWLERKGSELRHQDRSDGESRIGSASRDGPTRSPDGELYPHRVREARAIRRIVRIRPNFSPGPMARATAAPSRTGAATFAGRAVQLRWA